MDQTQEVKQQLPWEGRRRERHKSEEGGGSEQDFKSPCAASNGTAFHQLPEFLILIS